LANTLETQLANALVEHETLDMEEVKKVIKGERIRAIEQVINEDITRISSTPGLTAPETNVTAAADS
jgi:ATP-dependent metalloprotease